MRTLRTNLTCPPDPVPGDAQKVLFTYLDDGWYQIRQTFSPGPVTVRFRNETSRVVVALIEQVQLDPRAIIAAQVLANPDLRELAQSVAGQGEESSPSAVEEMEGTNPLLWAGNQSSLTRSEERRRSCGEIIG